MKKNGLSGRNVRVKKVLMFLLSLGLLFGLFGCGKKDTAKATPVAGEDEQYEILEIRYQGQANSVYIHELAEDLGYLEPLKLKYVGSYVGGPHDLQVVQTGQSDLGGAFMTAVINLAALDGKLLSVIGWMSSDDVTHTDFLVLEDSGIYSGRDLIGKTLGINTFGAQNEAVIKQYLFNEGLSPEEIAQVELVVLPSISFEQALRSKQIAGVILTGAARDKALDKGGIRVLFTDEKILGRAMFANYSVRKDFAEKYPNTTRKLVEAMAKAIEWSKATPVEEVRERMKNIMEKRDRDEDPSVLQYWRSYGITSDGGLQTDRDFQIWIDWLVRQGSLTEGQLKPSDLYTNKFNPYYKDN